MIMVKGGDIDGEESEEEDMKQIEEDLEIEDKKKSLSKKKLSKFQRLLRKIF